MNNQTTIIGDQNTQATTSLDNEESRTITPLGVEEIPTTVLSSKDDVTAGMSYSSIAEIRNALIMGEYTPRALYAYLDKYSDPSSGGACVRGSETDYHNLSVEFSRRNNAIAAAQVAIIGATFYPMSVDLLADAIKYAQEVGEIEICKTALGRLKAIDKRYWKWRTFVFVLDFLNDMDVSSSVEEFEQNLDEAKALIKNFKSYIPHDERAYMAEAEHYECQNQYEQAIMSLEAGIEKVPVAPQCCLKLADMYLELGEYNKVEKYARKGILASMQEQPSVSVGYLYYLLAMSMDAKRVKSKQDGNPVNEIYVQSIVTNYQISQELLKSEVRQRIAYLNTIRAKLIAIEKEEGIITGALTKADDDSDESENFLQGLRNILNKSSKASNE